MNPTPAALSSDGPPRFFALATLADGTLLIGTRGRGLVRSVDAGATWTPPLEPPGSSEIFGLTSLGGSDLVAATGAGVWRSEDSGDTWRLLGLSETRVYTVVHHAGALIAGIEGHGVLLTNDEGRTWTPAATAMAAVSVYRLLPLDADQILAGSDVGLWHLAREGTSWVTGAAALAGVPVYALARVDQETVLAGTRGAGVARSVDAGRTWRLDASGLPDPVVTCLCVDQHEVYAGTGLGVAHTADSGCTWQPHGEGLHNYRIFCLSVHPRAGLIAGSYESVWALAPQAAQWSEVDTGLVKDATSISLDAAGTLYAGSSDGLRRSTDAGATWELVTQGIGTARVHRVVRLDSGDLLAATDDGVARAPGEASPQWRTSGLAGRRVRCLLEPRPGVVLAGTLGSGLFRSSDGGETWVHVETGFASPHVYDLLDARGRVVLASGDPTGVFKSGVVLWSDDAGATWACGCDEQVTSYRAVESSSGTLFVGAQRCSVLRSRDRGATWTRHDTTGLIDVKLWALALDSADRVLLGTARGLMISDDEAETWTRVEEGLDGVTVYDVCAHPTGALVAATSIGVMRSDDQGRSWR